MQLVQLKDCTIIARNHYGRTRRANRTLESGKGGVHLRIRVYTFDCAQVRQDVTTGAERYHLASVRQKAHRQARRGGPLMSGDNQHDDTVTREAHPVVGGAHITINKAHFHEPLTFTISLGFYARGTD